MAKRKRAANDRTASPDDPPSLAGAETSWRPEDQIVTDNLALHDLFAKQARAMLDRTDLDEEQKQSILIAMSCPCCGAGALSFTARLKR